MLIVGSQGLTWPPSQWIPEPQLLPRVTATKFRDGTMIIVRPSHPTAMAASGGEPAPNIESGSHCEPPTFLVGSVGPVQLPHHRAALQARSSRATSGHSKAGFQSGQPACSAPALGLAWLGRCIQPVVGTVRAE
eukprot:COSAG01_NODE_342_length_18601_cov_43.546319_9_plen_134_part_00